MIVLILRKKKTKGRTLLHCAIYPNASFKSSLSNCSASGKKRGGDYHVRKAYCLLGLSVLLRPLFFLNLIYSSVLNLMNCKHRSGIGAMRADGSIFSIFSLLFFGFRLTVLQLKFYFNCNFRSLNCSIIGQTQQQSQPA